MGKTLLVTAVALGLGAITTGAVAAPSVEEMWKIIQQQQNEIDRLKSQQSATDVKLEETDIKVEATADALEQGGVAAASNRWASKTQVGGYGEIHYNNLDNDNNAASAKDDIDQIDLHRLVLFFNHQYNDKTRFFSELEVEHSLVAEDADGEVEVEQAFIEHDYTANHSLKAGLFLIPVGIINETHEPDTFYGTERNPVEKNIVPVTWWEAGVAFNGEIAPGLNYDVALTSGLGLDFTLGKYTVRDGRQKVSKARADAFAYTGRIKYTAIPGLELAATLQYQDDLYQDEFVTTSGNSGEVDALLYEVHAVYRKDGFGLRVLYASWDIDSLINEVKDGADEQTGWTIEPSYRINESWGVFARFNEWDNTAGASSDSEYQQIDVGVNYWLAPTVVLKADYQIQDTPDSKDEFNDLNLGLGWSF
ncbi:MAG: hypothetical protein V3T17_10020 [Pseudomonadales bacterium]